MQNCSLKFLQQISTGEKAALSWTTLCRVPQPKYGEFSTKWLYELAGKDSVILKHLPEADNVRRIRKEFVWNVVYNLYPEYMDKCLSAAREIRRKTLDNLDSSANIVKFNSEMLQKLANLDLPYDCKFVPLMRSICSSYSLFFFF